MSDVQTLKSYLVGLGFSVDAQQYKKFENTLAGAAKTVARETASIGGNLLKWQLSIIGMFTTVSTAILGTMDKVAQADQEYRLFGERMFISTNNARSLKIALDALGEPMEAIAFDPELHERFMQLQKDQKAMGTGLGGSFEAQMRGIRDMSFQLTRLKVEFQYLTMGTVSNIFKTLFGDGDVTKKLAQWNDWIINNLPMMAKQFSTYLVPVLKDTWEILKDVGKLLGVFGMEFSNVVGMLSGDKTLEDTSFSFDKLARSVGTVVHWIAVMMDYLVKVETKFPVLEALGGAAAGGIVAGPGGALVGAAAAGITGVVSRWKSGAYSSSSSVSIASGDMKALAAKIGSDLGVDPSLIYGQMALETNNFKNRGATDLHNYTGIGGQGNYKKFASDDEYASYFEGQIKRNYQGVIGATSPEQMAHAFKHGRIGSWYGDGSESDYGAGIRSRSGGYGAVSIGTINIMQPNASADEIANTVARKVQEQQGRETQRNLTQLTPVFQ